MKFLLVSLSLLLSGFPIAQSAKPNNGLPALHTIKEIRLSPSYSCRTADESKSGYQGTALFLSDLGKSLNRPDLLFNGACGSEDTFDVAMAGDTMSLIADLGADISLEKVTASKAFNPGQLARDSAYSKFTRSTKVVAGHTYAVLINRSDLRGLFVFTVTGHVKNATVDLRYDVKSYELLKPVEAASGFSWDR